MPRRRRILITTTGLLLTALAALAFVIWRIGGLEYYARVTRHPPVEYRGDGRFFDTGWDAGIHRFVVDLGSIDLATDGQYTFELQGLPVVHFVPYIVVSTPLVLNNSDRPQKGWVLTSARVQLSHADKPMVDLNAPLNEWIWSGNIGSDSSMLYLRDGCFDASPSRTVRLVITISNAAADAPPARLIVTGGGWQDYMTNELHGRTLDKGMGDRGM
jgi:hypothetical protein